MISGDGVVAGRRGEQVGLQAGADDQPGQPEADRPGVSTSTPVVARRAALR